MIFDREGAMAELAARVRGCTACPLARTRTLAVPGEGPVDAEVMLIGEAPGMHEDRQGRPFVGAAGAFLEELLAAAGLTRDQVFICNVLKCRPPGNRDPLPGEIEACRDFLDEQIDIIDPLVIVTLGRFSMAKFFPRQMISRIHGRPKEIAGRAYIPMYHPAAALRQANLREVMLNDFRKIPAVLDRIRSQLAAPSAPPEPVAQPAPSLFDPPQPQELAPPESASGPAPAPQQQTPPTAPPAPPAQITQFRLFE